MRELFKLHQYFRKYKKTVVLGVLYLSIANVFLVIIPIAIRKAIDQVSAIVEANASEGLTFPSVLFSQDFGWLLGQNALVLIGCVLVYGFLLFMTRQTLIVTSRDIEFDIRKDIYEHLQKLPYKYFAENKIGDIYVRATEDVNRVREYFGPAFMYTINTITRAGIIITIMALVNSELTLWALIPLPLLTAMAYFISGYINTMSKEIQEQYSVLAGRAQEAFSSIRLIKAYVRETYQEDKFNTESEHYRRKKLNLSALESLFFPLLNLLIGLSVILVIWQGGRMVMEGLITVGNIAEFIIYVAYLTWPVASLGYTINLIQRSAASNKRIQELLSEPVVISDTETTNTSITSIKGKVEFRNVGFSYPKSTKRAIQNISFTIDAGSKVGIVGRTGSGKTSLVQLIPRIFDVSSGEILIDDYPLSSIPIQVLRKEIGYVPQENFLFSDTIAENIGFGVENASMEEIENSSKKAQLLENVLEFDKKFKTMLGERGITLSGGQKQRTSLARAFIKQPKIFILDDSLSAVDTKTEDAILSQLRNEPKQQTLIMISHRISTVKACDQIFVLENGILIESGNHSQLLEKEGAYYQMYQKQIIEHELSVL